MVFLDPSGNSKEDSINRIQVTMDEIFEDKTLDLEELSKADYVCVNLDLILYKNGGLLNKAFSLLIRFHTQRKNFLDLLRSVQILESDESINFLREVTDKLTELRRMAQNSEFWLGQTDRESVRTAKNTIDILDYLSNMLIEESIDKEFSGEFNPMNQHNFSASDKEAKSNQQTVNNSLIELENEGSVETKSKQNL